MKVQELRQIISSADRVLLEKAFVETYKQLTKSQKEEADVLIQAALSGEQPFADMERRRPAALIRWIQPGHR